jgi:hypothetical protein
MLAGQLMLFLPLHSRRSSATIVLSLVANLLLAEEIACTVRHVQHRQPIQHTCSHIKGLLCIYMQVHVC